MKDQIKNHVELEENFSDALESVVQKIEVNASDELNVTVMGPASVIYSGDPKVSKTVHGPGSVERRASEGA